MRHKDTESLYKHKSDFSWGKKNNPYRADTPRKRFPVFKLLLGIILNATTVGLLAYHPFFYLSAIDINGLERTDLTQVRLFIGEYLQERRFLFFPNGSYFFFNLGGLEEQLKGKFTFETVHIDTFFPNELHIRVFEKVRYLIVDNEMQYLLIDTEGNTHEVVRNVGETEWKEVVTVTTTQQLLTSTTSDALLEMPSNNTTTPQFIEEKIVTRFHVPDFLSIRSKYPKFPLLHIEENLFNPEGLRMYISMHSEQFISLQEIFPEYTSGDSIDYIEIVTPYDMVIHGKKGIQYKFGTKKDDNVIEQLHIVSKLFEAGETVREYIDVRYKNRAYWK